MAEYKLIYFNLRGRAELCRLILQYGGIPHEDFRMERNGEEWPQIKDDMPFGQVPVLECNGQKLGQSMAMGRFLARKCGLAGKDDWQQAVADMYVDSIQDLMVHVRPLVMEADVEKKKEISEAFVTKTFMPFIERVEGHLRSSGKTFLTGDEITWADLALFNFASFIMEYCAVEKLEKAPLVVAIMDHVANLPAIKNWLEVRPKTPF